MVQSFVLLIYIFFQMILSASSIGVSCYLAYILHFVLQVCRALCFYLTLFLILQDFCVVCVSTYAVNVLLFFTRCAFFEKDHVIVQPVQVVTSFSPAGVKDVLWDVVIKRKTGEILIPFAFWLIGNGSSGGDLHY